MVFGHTNRQTDRWIDRRGGWNSYLDASKTEGPKKRMEEAVYRADFWTNSSDKNNVSNFEMFSNVRKKSLEIFVSVLQFFEKNLQKTNK